MAATGSTRRASSSSTMSSSPRAKTTSTSVNGNFSFGGSDHVELVSQDGHNIAPTVGPSDKPSTEVVTVSKKHKDRVEAPEVKGARVAKEH